MYKDFTILIILKLYHYELRKNYGNFPTENPSEKCREHQAERRKNRGKLLQIHPQEHYGNLRSRRIQP